ncbi:MAG: LysE family translocator [Kordiimonas sp.]
MSLESMFAFAVAIAILAATPGPGFFAVIAQAISNGPKSAFSMLAGIIAADILFIIAVVFGLGLLATQMGEMFYIIRLAGAAYLIYLGWKSWNSSIQDAPTVPQKNMGLKSLLAGFFITLGNPKAIFFYVAFLPTFIDVTAIATDGIITLCLIAAGVSLLVEGTYMFAASKMSHKFKSVSARTLLNRLSGSVLIGAGAIVGIRS